MMRKRHPFGFIRAKNSQRWIVLLLALLALGAVGYSPALAGSTPRQGGLNLTEDQNGNGLAPRFGLRVLKEGMSGPDVRVLNTIIGSRPLFSISLPSPYVFSSTTKRMVKRFQSRRDLKPTGVVNRRTTKRLVGSMKTYGASWYGPGFYGNQTACGRTLKRSTVGLAHKTLPCGTKVLVGYRGRYLLTRVIDRGPYIAGRTWDLTNGAREALRYSGIDRVRAAVAR